MNAADAKSVQSPDFFTAVVETHWSAVYSLLYSVTGNAHDCEDLTQETFLRALRHWKTFKQGTNLRAWLLRIATNALFDVRRKQRTLKITKLKVDLFSDAASAETDLDLQEQGVLVQAALAKLTELTRLVFCLRATEDLRFKEIAQMAGISEATARWHMHRARLTLVNSLSETCAN